MACARVGVAGLPRPRKAGRYVAAGKNGLPPRSRSTIGTSSPTTLTIRPSTACAAPASWRAPSKATRSTRRQRHRHVPAERRALHALQRADGGRGPRAKAASAGLERGLDRERLHGYITPARRLIWKTPWRSWKTSEKRAVKSATSVGNGVTVAQQTLTLFV